MHKVCGKCGLQKELSLANFCRRKTSKDGFDRECKECKRERDAKRYNEKKKEILKQKKDYYQKNRNQITSKQANYYRKNKTECHQRELKWRKNNPTKRRLINERRRTREFSADHTLKEDEWREIKTFFDYSCAYCGISEKEHIESIGERLHHEHVIPLVSGGGYDKTNIVPACRSCNSSKGNMNLSLWYSGSKGYSEERLNKLELFFERS